MVFMCMHVCVTVWPACSEYVGHCCTAADIPKRAGRTAAAAHGDLTCLWGEKDVRARRLPGKCWHQLEKHRRKYWSAPHLHNNSLRCVETHRTNVSSELKSKGLHWHLILTYAVFNETDSSQYTRPFWSRLERTCGRSKGGYCLNALYTSVL